MIGKLACITLPFTALLNIIKKQRKNLNPKPGYDSEWIWREERQKWVHESTLAKEIHKTHSGPTYEEWKEAQKIKPNEEINFILIDSERN